MRPRLTVWRYRMFDRASGRQQMSGQLGDGTDEAATRALVAELEASGSKLRYELSSSERDATDDEWAKSVVRRLAGTAGEAGYDLAREDLAREAEEWAVACR